MHVTVVQDFMSIFRVWYGEPKGDMGAVGGRSASSSSAPLRTQQQRVLVGRVSGGSNYKF